MAACMADRMVDRLSLTQLRRLASLGSLKNGRVADLTLEPFLPKVRALKDPEILAVSKSSAAISAPGWAQEILSPPAAPPPFRRGGNTPFFVPRRTRYSPAPTSHGPRN